MIVLPVALFIFLKRSDFKVKVSIHEEAVYQGRKETMRLTGLSRNALMSGERQGIFPHVRVGKRVLYNVPAVLAVLDRMAQEGGSI